MTYIGTDNRPDSENDDWCLSTSSRSRDSSLSTEGMIEECCLECGLDLPQESGSQDHDLTDDDIMTLFQMMFLWPEPIRDMRLRATK